MLEWWERIEPPVIPGELEYKQSPVKTTHYKNVNTLPYSKKFTLAFFSWITSSRYFSAHSISHLQYGDKVLCKNVAQLSQFQRNRHNNLWCPCAMKTVLQKYLPCSYQSMQKYPAAIDSLLTAAPALYWCFLPTLLVCIWVCRRKTTDLGGLPKVFSLLPVAQ